jgi:(1->4)-alpha-D-glucan 1-alpha-D-glucosylmutase
MQIPRATYRCQFNKTFRLADALALAPYLYELGISHIYASPLFKAAPNSQHGYDVCDFNQLNPEIGTEADLEKLATALHAEKMGLILDIVPNHMGIASPENLWWWDVLTHGEKSRFAAHFDIDWKPSDKDLHGKILAPILGAEYETLLNQGEFQLLFEQGKFVLGYHEHRLPIAPKTAAKLPKDAAALKAFNADFAALDKLIRLQHYHLAFHEHGDARLNYRRFFAVSSLAAVCVEDENTFAATHALLRRWLEKGWLDGLRVDHPDGLRDPAGYLQRLRALAPDAWIVVEKILEPGESLPASWPVQGTTGYDFLNLVNGLFIDPDAEPAFTSLYASFTGEPADYPALLVEKKREVLKTLLAAELNRLTGLLARIAAERADSKKISRAQLQEALAAVIARFPVYRSYIVASAPGQPSDIAAIKLAVHLACEDRKDLPPEIFAFIHAVLLKPRRGTAARNFVARFQQLTGAVMAKGAEDTVFYCFNRFASLNEVGGDPKKFGLNPEEFHQSLQRQRMEWPHSQLTTSTHDTKRAEDVRARLNLLSEIPELWAQAVQRWSAMNACHRENHFPDRNAEYLFYQTLAGAWPLSEDRAQAYMEKASHEAKQHTNWTRRNEHYEKVLRKFVAEVLRDPEFTTDLEHFTSRFADAGAVNSLAQTLIKLTAPGVPDIYQGGELWDFSLVDPDNRRPVDFALRQNLLKEAGSVSAEKAWERRAEGLPKLWLIQKTLKRRAQIADYSNLNYEPMFAHGAKAGHVLAFSRGGRVVTIVPRFPLKLDNDWSDTGLDLPAGGWRNEFTGEIFKGEIRLGNLFQKFPVALLGKEHD